MLEVKDGKIFVEGVETIDAELIGMAFKDIVEENPESSIFIANEKRLISMVDTHTELAHINDFAAKELADKEFILPYWPNFNCNYPSTQMLYSLLKMIRNKDLVFANKQ